MAELERRVSSLEDIWRTLSPRWMCWRRNQSHLDEALATLADAQTRTQQQFLETDKRIANLTSAIGELIQQMKSRAN